MAQDLNSVDFLNFYDLKPTIKTNRSQVKVRIK